MHKLQQSITELSTNQLQLQSSYKRIHDDTWRVGMIIYTHTPELQFLLVKSRNYGKWGCPKGHINKNENHVECAYREVYEETGIKFQNIDYKNYIIDRKIKYKLYIVYISNPNLIKYNVIDKHEILDIKWYKWSELKNHLNETNYSVKLICKYFGRFQIKQQWAIQLSSTSTTCTSTTPTYISPNITYVSALISKQPQLKPQLCHPFSYIDVVKRLST